MGALAGKEFVSKTQVPFSKQKSPLSSCCLFVCIDDSGDGDGGSGGGDGGVCL